MVGTSVVFVGGMRRSTLQWGTWIQWLLFGHIAACCGSTYAPSSLRAPVVMRVRGDQCGLSCNSMMWSETLTTVVRSPSICEESPQMFKLFRVGGASVCARARERLLSPLLSWGIPTICARRWLKFCPGWSAPLPVTWFIPIITPTSHTYTHTHTFGQPYLWGLSLT